MAASTVARNQQDVDQMSKKDRLWDSLSYTYGRQTDQSNESFNKAITQQDRNLLQRGMQRSSYGMQTLGDLQNQKIKAQNDIGYAKIADYENRLFQLEQQEKADEQWERQFAEGQRQFNEQMGFQQSEAERNQRNTEWTQAFQQSEAARDQANTVWNQNFQQGQADREQGNWEKQFAFSQEQWNTQKEQWDKEFGYQQMSDDQKLSYNYVAQIIANGNDPSDDLLKRAGLSREDANAMKAQAQSGGGGGGTPAWKKYGFPNKEAYDAYLKQYGQNPPPGSSEGTFFAELYGGIIGNAGAKQAALGAKTTLEKKKDE